MYIVIVLGSTDLFLFLSKRVISKTGCVNHQDKKEEFLPSPISKAPILELS